MIADERVAVPSYPLNIFQRLTRQWDALHPYNAAQLLHLPGSPNVGRIEESWRAALTDLNLGSVTVSRGRYAFNPINDRTPLVNLLPAGTDLQAFLSEEMNRPFEAKAGVPFRAFVVPDIGSYYFGVVYHHWIADSVSIRQLLRQWFFRAFDPSALGTISRRAAEKNAGGYWRLFGPDTQRWDLAGSVLDMCRWSSRMKRARRIESAKFPDMKIRFTLRRLPDGLANRLLPEARTQSATLNDLFLAAMAETCDRYVAAPPNERRHDLALGIIVDLRGQLEALREVFGLYLGFTSVLCTPPELADWPRLVRSIAAQNRLQKKTRAPESSMVRMFSGLMTGKLLSQKGILEFYRKRLPLSAGISNVNMNRTWVSHYHPDPILEYIRVSPTGPMLPLVFTPTTLGRGMHFGLTHRKSVISADTADACADDFADRLLSLLHKPSVLKMPQQREAS